MTSLRPGWWLLAVLGMVVLVLAVGQPERVPASTVSAARLERPSRPLSAVPAIDPFTATPAELCLLPGFGPRLSRRVHQAIHHHGFTRLEELASVRGIGPSRLSVLRTAFTMRRGS